MTTKLSNSIAILTAGVFALTGGLALAGNNGGGFSFNNGKFGIQFGNNGAKIVRVNNGGNGGNNNGGNRNNNNGGLNNQGNNGNQGTCNSGNLGGNNGGVFNNGGVVNNNGVGTGTNGGGVVKADGQVFGQALEPLHSTYIVRPFDTLFIISHREYNTSNALKFIAQFNGLDPEAALTPGQRLALPSISADGRLAFSKRPPAEEDSAAPAATANVPSTPAAVPGSLASTTTPAPAEPALPKVKVGSTLVLDGQTFGDEAGVARLRVSGLSLPVEVLEWTNASVKVRLPKVELTSATKASLEVLRGDGSVVSSSGIELTAAAETLASTN